MRLHECTGVILSSPDRAAAWLKLADTYMQQCANNDAHLVLPKAFAFLKPIIEAYTFDLEGFVQYIIGIRDSLPYKSGAYKDVQQYYRTVNGRLIQQQRRERTNRAVQKAEQLWGSIPFIKRQVWVANLEHSWAKRCQAFLAAAIRGSGKTRLTHDERAETLAEFWDLVDTEIHNGELPRWN